MLDSVLYWYDKNGFRHETNLSDTSPQEWLDAVENAPEVPDGGRAQGAWKKVSGYYTPGGDPVYECPFCGEDESRHVNGIECHHHRDYCPCCGAKLEYR
ncbi:MAG: hypothetical protein IJG15_05270 [Lachnospiraceae bacterium]|nr:hypothetical protein [Lachnospiraceae bacterium]